MKQKCSPESRKNPPEEIARWDDAKLGSQLQSHRVLYKPELNAIWRAFMRDVRREARKRGLI